MTLHKKMKCVVSWIALRILVVVVLMGSYGWVKQARGDAGTIVGFYDKVCPLAESIVREMVKFKFSQDKSTAPALLRLFFHDSFVQGADASILLDSNGPDNLAEKEALANESIRGYDFIQVLKDALEDACPGIVSCADIIALAARDVVAMAGGPSFAIPTGRRDSLTSKKLDADILPGPSSSIADTLAAFRAKGLGAEDLVALLGAHTIGITHCDFVDTRLSDFDNSGAPDPSMNITLLNKLTGVCKSGDETIVELDQGTPNLFDSSYFVQVSSGNGILPIDQELTGDASTAAFVKRFTHRTDFFPTFAQSMVKLGNVGVITTTTKTKGEIRRRCNVINSKNKSPRP